MRKKGAYILYLNARSSLRLSVGALGQVSIPRGRYAYVGSARAGIASRVNRHHRQAEQKRGIVHWHIDHLLLHPDVEWAGSAMAPDGDECVISRRIAEESGVTVPVEGFGSSDCRSGCKAHLYRLPEKAWRPGFARWIKDPKV